MCGRNGESECQCYYHIRNVIVLMERPGQLQRYNRFANAEQCGSYRWRHLFSNSYHTGLGLHSYEQYNGNR